METLLGALLAYIIGLAANERTGAILKRREARLNEELDNEEALRRALASHRSLRDELRGACVELARNRDHLGVTPQEEPLWRLLSDHIFQADLAEWLMAGGIAEGNVAKERLIRTMEGVLAQGDASPEQIDFLKTGYFEALDKVILSHPTLAHWRHQLSLDYLRQQVAVLRARADEAAGQYSPERQKSALDRYCEMALAAWDIIELGNLPEGDVDIVAQKLLLRQLYMPLRIKVEATNRAKGDDAALANIEEQREAHRQREAGHRSSEAPDESRNPVGERLGVSRRLVVLGDPGGGKTTMLRWMATAYLLQHKGDPAFDQIPDTSTLPNDHWIPVLIRCRDIGPDDLCRCFTDFLRQHLHKSELNPDEADVMQAVILDRIANGEALLLVDGLDEINDPSVRMMFCQELERTAVRYPDAHVVVTSRIVGYRDMPYRMGSGFEHGVIADLNREDKDLFARRWVNVTEQHQTTEERAKRAEELADAFHSNDRIERLTGNPMLLTTMALVKRKVGKLPNKRTKLYAEAVAVLLNWNPRYHQIIEEDEAFPQLEYVAYAMCQRGVQRLTQDDILDLLDKARTEYPSIRAIRQRPAKAFLEHLEARSSILIKSGGIWDKNKTQEKAAWEFRHLTFQEYLAARALIDGRYPDRDRSKSLAEEVAGLAGAVEASGSRLAPGMLDEVQVPESWREALRLVVADCRGDDVDDVLLAILNPMEGEDAAKTGRPRAVLAGLCLADEPDVSDQVAERVIAVFAGSVEVKDADDFRRTILGAAAIELGRSMWVHQVKQCLIEEYCTRPAEQRWSPGCLWGIVEVAGWARSDAESPDRFAELVQRLSSGDRTEELSAALTVMLAAYNRKAVLTPGLVDGLIALLEVDRLRTNAASWALMWLAHKEGTWSPNEAESTRLIAVLDATADDEKTTARWLATILGHSGDKRAVQRLLAWFDDPDKYVRDAVARALGELGFKEAVGPLSARLDDPDVLVRGSVVKTLGELGRKEAVGPLLSRLDDAEVPVRVAVVEALGKLGCEEAVEPLLARLDDAVVPVRVAVVEALGNLGREEAVEPLLARLDDAEVPVRVAVVEALGKLGFKDAVEPLLARLDDPDERVRRVLVSSLASERSEIDRILLSRDLDGAAPGIDPRETINSDRIVNAATRLKIAPEEARAAYQALAADFHLTIE